MSFPLPRVSYQLFFKAPILSSAKPEHSVQMGKNHPAGLIQAGVEVGHPPAKILTRAMSIPRMMLTPKLVSPIKIRRNCEGKHYRKFYMLRSPGISYVSSCFLVMSWTMRCKKYTDWSIFLTCCTHEIRGNWSMLSPCMRRKILNLQHFEPNCATSCKCRLSKPQSYVRQRVMALIGINTGDTPAAQSLPKMVSSKLSFLGQTCTGGLRKKPANLYVQECL